MDRPDVMFDDPVILWGVISVAVLTVAVATYFAWREWHHRHNWVLVMDATSEDLYRCSECGRERWEQHFLPTKQR